MGLYFQKKNLALDEELSNFLKDLKLNKNLEEDAHTLSGCEK